MRREITETEKLLPREVREKMEMEESRKRRLDLKRLKDIMWKKHRDEELKLTNKEVIKIDTIK